MSFARPGLVTTVLFLSSPFVFAQTGANPALRAAGGAMPPTTSGPPAPTAVLTSFTDHALWLATIGGGTTLIDFDSITDGTLITNQLAASNIASVTGTSIFASGGTQLFVTSSQSLPFPMYVAGTLPSEPNFISNEMAAPVYATGTITFHFTTPVMSVGAFVADQSPLANFVIDVSDASGSLGMIAVPPLTLPSSFVGLVSDTPFTSATFYPQSDYDSWGLDNVELGGGAPVPTFCSGDGTGTACPCGNAGAANNGCASSVSAAGAHLTATGNASIASDTLVLGGSLMPNSSALYFQGTSQTAGGAGAVFGDGLRCAGGTVVRIGTKLNASGASSYPAAGDTPISIKGANSAGAVRTYQCWYRNAAAFCTPSTFNLTNGVALTWGP